MKSERYIALILVLLIALSVCACGKQSADSDKDPAAASASISAEHQEQLVLASYMDIFYPFDPGFTVEGLAFAGQTLAAVGYMDGNYALSLNTFTIEPEAKPIFEQTATLSLNEILNMTSPIFCGIAAKGETFCLLFGDISAEWEGLLLTFTQDGQLAESVAVGQLNESGVNGITFCGERSLVAYGPSIELIDLDTGEHNLIPITKEDYVWAAAQCSEGTVVFTNINGCSLLEPETLSAACVDAAVLSSCVCQDSAGGCLYYDSQALCEYDIENHQSSELLSWNLEKVPGGYARYIGRVDENTFFVLGSNTDTVQIIGQAFVSPVENDIVNVAIVKDINGTETQAAARVMQMAAISDDYHYIITEYGEEDLNRLIAEISTGNSPDLVLFGRELNTSSDFFEDLYPYLDRDEELSRDSFLPGLLSALEVRGQLHELWPTVMIDTVAIRASDYDQSREFTTEYCQEIMEQRGYRSVFGSFMSADNLLLWIGNISTGAFVDQNTGTCDFTSGDFAALLQWCHEMDMGVVEGKEGVQYEVDEIMLSLEVLSIPQRLIYLQEAYGQPMVFVGFPNADGNGSFYENAGIGMAIPVNSANKEGAWNFIRTQLTLRSQLTPANVNFCLPANYQAFLRNAANNLEQPEYEQLIALVEQTTQAINYSNQQINSIILECGRNYLAGKSSLEDAVSAVQSRVSIYVAEQFV